MINGIYSIYFSGITGEGFGILILQDQIITGSDATGASYDGNYRVTDKGILGELNLLVPPGVQLVTGAFSGGEGGVLNIPISLPLNFANGQTLTVPTPTGLVNVIFKKLRDLH